ncbi:RHTO0S07e06040g1_1 [Rhodotorula toruloides]|uniref:RHTO0S07e06040g1_1 n=1 Tax=Rhodotorula toruloides TaxID=5286 RepID=A0A061B7U9_RHOTO|nr:RHTO0S07e06040g1_1 [Rhodotorula toruloides]
MAPTAFKEHAPATKHEFASTQGEPVIVRFAKGDPEDPAEGWSRWKRYRALGLAMLVTYLSAYNASANGAASAGFRKEHPSVSASVFQASSFTYLAMLGIGPLVLAPVSEATGRRPQIVICTFVIAVLFLGQALSPNVYSLIFCRWVQGTAACIEGATAAGVVADLWPKRTRGPAMGLFVLTVFTANATGPLCSNWIAQTVGWRWVYWVQLISNSICFVLCLFLFPEPRADVILGKRCKKLQAESGRPHFVEGLEGTESMLDAVKLSLTRPLLYLFTERALPLLSLTQVGSHGSEGHERAHSSRRTDEFADEITSFRNLQQPSLHLSRSGSASHGVSSSCWSAASLTSSKEPTGSRKAKAAQSSSAASTAPSSRTSSTSPSKNRSTARRWRRETERPSQKFGFTPLPSAGSSSPPARSLSHDPLARGFTGSCRASSSASSTSASTRSTSAPTSSSATSTTGTRLLRRLPSRSFATSSAPPSPSSASPCTTA